MTFIIGCYWLLVADEVVGSLWITSAEIGIGGRMQSYPGVIHTRLGLRAGVNNVLL